MAVKLVEKGSGDDIGYISSDISPRSGEYIRYKEFIFKVECIIYNCFSYDNFGIEIQTVEKILIGNRLEKHQVEYKFKNIHLGM